MLCGRPRSFFHGSTSRHATPRSSILIISQMEGGRLRESQNFVSHNSDGITQDGLCKSRRYWGVASKTMLRIGAT